MTSKFPTEKDYVDELRRLLESDLGINTLRQFSRIARLAAYDCGPLAEFYLLSAACSDIADMWEREEPVRGAWVEAARDGFVPEVEHLLSAIEAGDDALAMKLVSAAVVTALREVPPNRF